MGVIPFLEVVSFSAEHHTYRVKNLINGGKWSCPVPFSEKELEVELSLPACFIDGIDIGNFGTSSVEIQVNRASQPASNRETLVMNTTLMNRLDYQRGFKKETMIFLDKQSINSNVAEKWWDRLRVVCRQPFRSSNSEIFGLSTLVIRGKLLQDASLMRDECRKSNENGLHVGVDSLLKKVDRQLPTFATRSPPLEVTAIENSRFFANAQNAKLSSPLSRSGRLVTQSNSGSISRPSHSVEMKFRDNFKFESKFNRPSEQDKNEKSLSKNDFHSSNSSHPQRRHFSSEKRKSLEENNDPAKKVGESRKKLDFSTTSSTPDQKARDDDEFKDPKNFKKYSKEVLEAEGVLVQFRRYKSDRELPIIGGRTIKVPKNQAVIFYKRGREIFMTIGDKIYRPDVQPEHLGGLFKDYTETELADNDRLVNRQKNPREFKCPLCGDAFDSESDLVEHCSDCQGNDSDGTADEDFCPICGRRFEVELLESHASQCAQTMFDS